MLAPASPRKPEERLAALRTSELFRGLDEASLARMDEALEWLSIEADAPLFSQGDAGDALFVVIDGRIDIWSLGPDGAEVHVSRLGPGQAFGELALLADQPRSASARAARDSTVVRLARAAFERLGANDPRITLALSRYLVDRALAKSASPPRSVAFAIVGACEDAPIVEVADRLVAALSAWRPALRVDAAAVDSAVGAGAARATLGEQEHDRVARWLDTAEAGTSSLVLVADREDSAWTTRCVRQADVVLLVGRPRSRPARLPARLASPRQGAHDRRELILVHPEGTDRPSGAAPWLGAIAVDAWHHVRLGVPDDFRRVARFLTGRAVGLAMSGGAARGFAHIGVLRALREAGVPIDLVCGTSMGSWVAAMASLNWSDARIAKIMQEEMVDRSPLDYQLPVLAMAGGRRFDAMLLALFGDGLAEDTWRRFFSVCCSLTRSTVVRHSTGSLARAVRASCSLPGLFPPVVEGGEVLVDGVFLDNLPAEAAAQAGAGRTIAVNVLPPVAGDWENFADRSTLRQVARMLSPRAEDRLPPIVKLGMQGVFLGTANASARIRREVDLFIEPAVGKIWFLDFGACKRVIELGYEAAKPAIADWLRRDPSVLVG